MQQYCPSKTNEEILDAAFNHIESVPYKVSLRWVFYRLLQEGYYSTKKHYSKWKSLSSVARKRFYLGWNPETLADDTREIFYGNGGYYNEKTLRAEYFNDLIDENPVYLDHFAEQDEVVFICFEARAMADQFRYYTERINLVPFGGDPSIPLKWKIAKEIERWSEHYQLDIRILYFGDYDPKGQQIADSAMKDIMQWCDVPFKITHCGLTLDQAIEYSIPENPDKPGEYQWEALNDDGAAEIIQNSISMYVDMDIIETIKNQEFSLTEEFKEKLRSSIGS